MSADTDDTKTPLDAAVPKSDAMENLSEEEKEVLEAQGEAEHEIGPEKEELHDEAEEKSED